MIQRNDETNEKENKNKTQWQHILADTYIYETMVMENCHADGESKAITKGTRAKKSI